MPRPSIGCGTRVWWIVMTPPWQVLDDHHDQAPHAGFQSDGARIQAEELHESEARLQGTHGSISTHDRHNQGKRDQRS